MATDAGAEAPGDCPICCFPLNRAARRGVECAHCRSTACVQCVKVYLLSVDEPECMACKKPWTAAAVEASLPRRFVLGPLRAHREDVLLRREKSLMPETLAEIQRRRECQAVQAEIRALEAARDAARRRLAALAAGVEPSRGAFTRACPAPGCRGFLSQESVCGLCAARVCPDCHELLDDRAGQPPHACDAETLASVRAIERDSKPCPRCGSMIHRLYGCNQMFCTAPGCHTAFCWRTLRILNAERIHNPHYFEFLQRRNGGAPLMRELDDIPCGGMPSTERLTKTLARGNVPADAYVDLATMHEYALHVRGVEVLRFPAAPDVIDPAANRDVRMKYLRGEISEARLKRVLQGRERRRQRVDAVHQVLATVTNVAADLFRGLVVERASPEAVEYTRANMRALVDHAREALAGVSRRFRCQVPLLSTTFRAPVLTGRP